MFRWLSGLPAALWADEGDGPAVSTQEVEITDPNVFPQPPAGTVWGAKIDDGTKSWYVGYHSCAGYDYVAPDGWCGGIQISHRADGSTRAYHLAWLKRAGESVTFGTRGFVTVSVASDVPGMLAAPAKSVRVRVAVNRNA
jgi:hypothetical protein